MEQPMATKIKNEVPKAIVVHCRAHYFNLC